ncbi:hypothetical protein BJ741DRAFT_625369 [Chytriomyces cf. hyalinus JEL632]|nr:hypothetical protein BJ741DRAFT_625369 [Chytriomyces cf. hyalinus JEL632]
MHPNVDAQTPPAPAPTTTAPHKQPLHRPNPLAQEFTPARALEVSTNSWDAESQASRNWANANPSSSSSSSSPVYKPNPLAQEFTPSSSCISPNGFSSAGGGTRASRVYVNPTRILSGGVEKTKLTPDELAKKMDQIRIQNIEIQKQRQAADADQAQFEANLEAQRKREHEIQERNRKALFELNKEREANARRKAESMAAREWDMRKSSAPHAPFHAPPARELALKTDANFQKLNRPRLSNDRSAAGSKPTEQLQQRQDSLASSTAAGPPSLNEFTKKNRRDVSRRQNGSYVTGISREKVSYVAGNARRKSHDKGTVPKSVDTLTNGLSQSETVAACSQSAEIGIETPTSNL